MNSNPKPETLNPKQTQNYKPKTVLDFEFKLLDLFRVSDLVFSIFLVCFFCLPNILAFAQDSQEIEFNLDINSGSEPLPKIFNPNIDLSGRAYHRTSGWPKSLAAVNVLDTWQKEIGFNGLYRLQYNLWEINEAAKEKTGQNKLLSNYEEVIKKISDAGGTVILDIYGTPAGLGKVLDKRSQPLDPRAFKELVKGYIRELSCNKKYNIWYEVWSAPDLEDFFLGRSQEYLGMYRMVCEAVNELEAEYKVNIPVGGPSVSWWFQGRDNNSIVTPERSQIYELIKYCNRYHLPLDFITWHAYSTDPKVEAELTKYNKPPVALIRDWLNYFGFDRDTPLIIDEWNYDGGANLLPARQEKANITASYIPARIVNMREAGLTQQLYFCLEDFQNNPERVTRNVGIFWFDPESSEYKGGPKATYNIFKMLFGLGKEMFILPKINDEFIGVIATKSEDYISILFYNYIDPYIARNYLSRNIGILNDAERKVILNLVKSDNLGKVIDGQTDISGLRISARLKNMLKKAQELNRLANAFKDTSRGVKLNIKNLKDSYLYQRYVIDSASGFDGKFSPAGEKEIGGVEVYQETLSLPAYSVEMLILKKKPKEKAAAQP